MEVKEQAGESPEDHGVLKTVVQPDYGAIKQVLLAQHRGAGDAWGAPPRSPLDALMERGEATNPPILGVSPLEKPWSGNLFVIV